MSGGLDAVERRIRRLTGGKLRKRLEVELRELEDAVTKVEDGADRQACLDLIRRMRVILMGGRFEQRVRYVGASLMMTVPARVARELGLEHRDRVEVMILKREEAEGGE